MMRRLILGKMGAALMVAALIAGGSIAYATIQTTGEVAGVFTVVEANYDLFVHDGHLEALSELNFGEVVQGEGSVAGFAVENRGNTGTKIGFRVRTEGDGSQVFEPTGRCHPRGSDKRDVVKPGTDADDVLALRRKHQAFHDRIGDLDTAEKVEVDEKFHDEIAGVWQDRLQDPDDATNVRPDARQWAGQSVEVPGIGSFCFVVGADRGGNSLVAAPGHSIGVRVLLSVDLGTSLGPKSITILVDGHNRDEGQG